MAAFRSVNIQAPARVVALLGEVSRLGALPRHKRPLAEGESVANDRLALGPGARVVLQVEGGERLAVEAGPEGPRTYFFHIVDGEAIGHRLMK